VRDIYLPLVLATVLSLALVGCLPQREPHVPPPGVDFLFFPSTEELQVQVSDHLDFQVRIQPEAPLETVWQVDDQVLGTGPRFRFFPSRFGWQTVTVRASYGAEEAGSTWKVLVLGDHSQSIQYFPPDLGFALAQGARQIFSVQADSIANPEFTWTLNGETVGTESSYLYDAESVGQDTLLVILEGVEEFHQRLWYVTVQSVWHGMHFSPVLSHQELVETQTREFRVLDATQDTSIDWFLNAERVGTGPVYHYTAGSSSRDSLGATLVSLGDTLHHHWIVSVDSLGTCPPSAVGLTDVNYGLQAGQVLVTWRGVEDGVFPVSGYHVLFSHTGPITAQNMDQAQSLEPTPHLGQGTEHRQLVTTSDGLVMGRDTWFALRTRDTAGQLAETVYSSFFATEEDWALSGTIRSSFGHVLQGVPIRDMNLGLAATSDEQGEYRLGPFSAGHQVVLEVGIPQQGEPTLPWHGFTSGVLDRQSDPEQNFYLLDRAGCDPDCETHDGDFLHYLQYMTRTSLTTVLRPDHRLYHWAEYPLRVHVPAHAEGGVDFAAQARWCLNLWNELLGGDPLFVETPLAEQAHILCRYSPGEGLANGEATMLEPSDQDYSMGDVPPELMQVWVNTELPTVMRFRETMLHELGHAVGLYRHSMCNQVGYLMYFTAAGALEDGPENAIHQDEIRAVNVIRTLPQGTDMSNFR
jgi:hypothetical protein